MKPTDVPEISGALRAGVRRAEPMVWLSAGAVTLALMLLVGLLFLLASRGFSHFWPQPLILLDNVESKAQLGILLDREPVPYAQDYRLLLHLGGEDFFDSPLVWVEEATLRARSTPQAALAIERRDQGPLFAFAEGVDYGEARLELSDWNVADQVAAIHKVRGTAGRVYLRLASGRPVTLPDSDLIEVSSPNAMSGMARIRHAFSALGRFVREAPRRGNVQGGVFPAIVGTVLLVLLMTAIVAPLGVLAAVYLQEYAQRGPLTRMVRIGVNNLAGVPSIVYGVFGLGFFVYGLGGSLDQLFFSDSLPAPTLGAPGLLWAALTMALLTLPVVIVSTEEGLARVPRNLREGSLALGATRAEALFRVVLPAASQAVLTGLILAVARATGEVAPLILVGVAKYAPGLPVSSEFPFLHLDQQFMHLGFYIYDLGFQSPSIETAEGLVFATALLLVLIVLLLNLAAVMLRSRLRNAFGTQELR